MYSREAFWVHLKAGFYFEVCGPCISGLNVLVKTPWHFHFILKAIQVFYRLSTLGLLHIQTMKPQPDKGSPVPDDLLRFSIGIENVEDLIQDLELAIMG